MYVVDITEKKGKGAFATQEISAGTVIGDYLGKVTKYEDVFIRDYPFLMYLDDTQGIVADKNGVGVQNINHSCNPNATMYPYKGHTLFVAIRDILPTEEITISYRFTPIEECDNCKHFCFCESKNCLGTMHSTSEEYKKWQDYLAKKEKQTEKEINISNNFLQPLSKYPLTILSSELFPKI